MKYSVQSKSCTKESQLDKLRLKTLNRNSCKRAQYAYTSCVGKSYSLKSKLTSNFPLHQSVVCVCESFSHLLVDGDEMLIYLRMIIIIWLQVHFEPLSSLLILKRPIAYCKVFF